MKVNPVLGAATKFAVDGLGFNLYSTAVQGPSDDHMVKILDTVLQTVVKRLTAKEVKSLQMKQGCSMCVCVCVGGVHRGIR